MSKAGWPIWQATYLPYGEEYDQEMSINHYRFTGKERDSESNLDYFGARYDANALGRFTSPAPLLNSVSGVSLFTAASTVQLGANQRISKPYIVAADRTLKVIKTVRPMSAAEIATGFAVGNRLLPAAAMNVVSKVAPIVSKASIWLTVGALAVEGGFALACN